MAIAKALNADNVPTVQDSQWCQASVRRVLANPLYKGWIRHDGEVYPGIHEPIVSEELWDRAAEMRATALRSKGHTGGRWPKGPHLFTKGLLRCASCGHAMIPRTDPNRRGGHYEVYICDGRRRNGPEFCSQMPIDRATVDEPMLGELTRKYIDLDETRARIGARIVSDSARAAEALVQAEREANAAQERYQRVQRSFQDGIIEPEDWAEQRPGLIAGREAAEAEVTRVREHADELATAAPLLDAESELLRQLAELRTSILDGVSDAPNLDALRRVLGQLFKNVTYFPAEFVNREAWIRDGVPEASRAFLQVDLDPSVIERYEPPWNDAEPTCGHTLHVETCSDCREFGQSLFAEPYDPDEPEPTPIVRKAVLPLEQPLREGLSSTSSQPRSRKRTRASSSSRAVSANSGVSGSIRLASPSASRTASISDSVSPLTSVTTSCGWHAASNASALARLSASSTS